MPASVSIFQKYFGNVKPWCTLTGWEGLITMWRLHAA